MKKSKVIKGEALRSRAIRLARTPLFEGLTKKELLGILPVIEWKKIPKGSVVFKEGSAGDAVFLIEKGRVLVSKAKREGGSHNISILSDGDFFGEMGMLEGKPRSATTQTREDTLLIIVPGDKLLKWVYKNPRSALTSGLKVVRSISERLRQTTDILTALHGFTEALLKVKTKDEILDYTAKELEKIISSEAAAGGVLLSYNPYIEEYVAERHWGQVPSHLLAGLKEPPPDSAEFRTFVHGESVKDGCLVLVGPHEKNLLRKTPAIETFGRIVLQALVNAENLAAEELKQRMKTTAILT